jgi:hypothetical protein
MMKPRRMRLTGHVKRMGQKRNTYIILVRKPEGNSSLGRPGCKREDNIIIDLRLIEWSGMDCTDLAQDRDQ